MPCVSIANESTGVEPILVDACQLVARSFDLIAEVGKLINDAKYERLGEGARTILLLRAIKNSTSMKEAMLSIYKRLTHTDNSSPSEEMIPTIPNQV